MEKGNLPPFAAGKNSSPAGELGRIIYGGRNTPREDVFLRGQWIKFRIKRPGTSVKGASFMHVLPVRERIRSEVPGFASSVSMDKIRKDGVKGLQQSKFLDPTLVGTIYLLDSAHPSSSSLASRFKTTTIPPPTFTSMISQLPFTFYRVLWNYDYIFVAKVVHLGARRVLVTGTGPLGRVLTELAQNCRNDESAVEVIKASSLFNPQFDDMVPVAYRICYCEYGMLADKGHTRGLAYVPQRQTSTQTRICMYLGHNHPSEKVNRLIVDPIMIGSHMYMHPMNLRTIFFLDSVEMHKGNTGHLILYKCAYS
ncbi:hypothetical protein OSB04_015051 [Centaurea solstitialis]|uniref:Uncharacterized protein n=1 Tax=Centaurea solstitialis TaxID=347529 RepID=A0AA38T9F7_9ASTR|nr:hypothetical protein OSB04_015051 [Centaurea solstitialis]